jgi:hypothetical protein
MDTGHALPQTYVEVRSTPVKAGAALRNILAMRGYRALLPTDPQPSVLRVGFAAKPAHEWVQLAFEPSEACDEGLCAALSSDLRTTVRVAVLNGAALGAREWERGTLVDALDWVEGTLARDTQGRFAPLLAGAQTPAQVLEAVWQTGSVAIAPERLRWAGFAEPVRRSAGPVLEVDPLLECPECGGPMLLRTSRRGPFFGCAAFPACRGTMSQAQADAARRRGIAKLEKP